MHVKDSQHLEHLPPWAQAAPFSGSIPCVLLCLFRRIRFLFKANLTVFSSPDGILGRATGQDFKCGGNDSFRVVGYSEGIPLAGSAIRTSYQWTQLRKA